jgi:hypothetical protein
MAERAKQLRIYGAELCAEEAAAVEGIMRMLTYQQSAEALAQESSNTTAIGGGRDHLALSRAGDLTLSAFREVLRDMEQQQSDEEEGGDIGACSDVFLPPFVRKPLEDMRAAESDAGEAVAPLRASSRSLIGHLLDAPARRRHERRHRKFR